MVKKKTKEEKQLQIRDLVKKHLEKENKKDMFDEEDENENKEKKKKKMLATNVDIEYSGTQIILPEINGKKMSFDEGIEWLKRKKAEDEQEHQPHYEFPGSPLDAAVAFQRALAHIYGWTEMVTTPPAHMFDSDHPPITIGVPIGPDETMQVALGRCEIPGVKGYLETFITARNNEPKFIISGKIRKKFLPQIDKIADETRRHLKEQSIYKGKAVKISWDWMRKSDPKYDPIKHAPQFMELSGIKDDDLIFGQEVLNDLQIGLFTPIEYSSACREVGIPLKRGVLLYGPYGTGKTMTAYVSALKAERNGWTFVYLDNVVDLKKALDFASHYAPCVVFAEDIDRMMTGERSVTMDEVLNTLDGIDTKTSEVLTVFTTNHIEKINRATLRMGRLDTLVHVSPPTSDAVQRLVRLYGRGLLEEGCDLDSIGALLAGKIPAFIREVTERAKLAAIGRIGSGDIKGHVLEIDLINAANAMEPHAEMLKPKEEMKINIDDYDIVVPGRRLQTLNNQIEAVFDSVETHV